MGGHGKGHHDFGEKFVIPDYKIYKVEDAPRLVELREELAARGLKDPWLRNEVWRFNGQFGTVGSNARKFFFRGFGVGFAAFLVTIALEKAFEKKSDKPGHH